MYEQAFKRTEGGVERASGVEITRVSHDGSCICASNVFLGKIRGTPQRS